MRADGSASRDWTLLRAGRALVPVAVLLAVGVAAATVVIAWGRPSADGYGPFGIANALRIAGYALYAVVGGLVAVRRPTNPVGWILVAGGAAMTVQLGLEEYVHTAVVLEPGRWPGATTTDWLAEWLWVLPLTSLQFAALLFPTGRLPSPRWRPVARVLLVGDALLLVCVPVATWPHRGRLALDDLALVGSPLWAVIQPLAIAMVGAVVLAWVSLIVRHRRAVAEERLQLRWLALAAVLFISAMAVEAATGASPVNAGAAQAWWPSLVGSLGIAAIPVAAAFAILKRRLYEIDRIVSRVVAYLLVSGLLAGVYLGLVLALGSAARAVTGESGDLVVALSTLAVAAVARPLLVGTRAIVDRRFNRARYDASVVVDQFARELRDPVDVAVVRDGLIAATRRILQPATVRVWLPNVEREVRS